MIDSQMQHAISYYITVCASQTKAYKHAYPTDGMTPKEINRAAKDVFDTKFVKDIIKQAQDQAASELGITAKWVLKRLVMLAEFNINKFLYVDDNDGKAYYDFSTANDNDWYCINEYTSDTIVKSDGDDIYDVEKVKLKSHCKLKALELIGKHASVDAFSAEKVNVTSAVSLTGLPVDEYKKMREQMLEEDDC